MSGAHPRHELDNLLNHPVRLSIVASLVQVDLAEFALVRETVEISEPMLSKQVALLEDAGYVDVTKGRVARRTRTWLGLTAEGRAAFERHVRALQAIAALGAQPRWEESG